MPPKRMTANPIRPARYRPGKPTAEEHSSSSESDSEPDDEEPERQSKQSTAPKATSFPAGAGQIANNLKNVDLNARRREAIQAEERRLAAEKAARNAAEEGFETESESESGSGSGSGSEESSSEEEESDESSDDEAARRRKLLRPVFLKKDQRKNGTNGNDAAAVQKSEHEIQAEEEARRKAKADALVQEQLELAAAARAAGKKHWDDEDNLGSDAEIDDTDGIDPEEEHAAWRLRELRRVKRERLAIEEAEKEREEIERRRNLTTPEREAEDAAYLAQQKEERAGKGTMAGMQKYFHRGAFFQDDAADMGLDRRDIMGSRFTDQVRDVDTLPEYMQIRDMTKLGRKGRTKYKDMKSEDTGRWGDFLDRRRGGPGGGDFRGVDERFRPDAGGGWEGRDGATGANARPVGERKRVGGAERDRDEREGKRARVDD
ncbi:splicing factor, Prp19-binding domain-containing protein [Phyllosticta citribraziliensis]|uniref:Splicing factor, Prp19-binding domain-containing protein n=1 Tax=Phyllosticta citribraziliensis TaxID=989973 RepID=A0ABR1M2X2_9PEZI